MRTWVWMLPCWIWKVAFRDRGKQRVKLDGEVRFALRIDDEFVLIYHPEGLSPERRRQM